MPSHYTITVGLGSDKYAKRRKELYLKAAKKLESGNLSRLMMRCVDKVLGIKMPYPILGRPRKTTWK